MWGFLAISGPGANLEASFRRGFRRQPGLEPQERIAVLTYLKYQDGITPADMRRLRRKNLIPTSSYTPWMLELALREGNAYNSSMQYTLRNIPEALDAALRERSRVSGRSLNEVAVEALGRGLGLSQEALRHRDLKDLAGTWRNDPAFDRAIVDQHAIDDELWK